jgi:hypothetical protein
MIMHNIFHLTFALAAAALTSSPVAVSAHSSSDDFDRGYSQGQQKAQNIWNNKEKSNFRNINDFEDKVDDYI